jgi:hypothetical protein
VFNIYLTNTDSFVLLSITAQGWRRAAKKMTSGFVTDKRIEGGLSVYTAPAVGAGVCFLSAGHYSRTESCLTLRCNVSALCGKNFGFSLNVTLSK